MSKRTTHLVFALAWTTLMIAGSSISSPPKQIAPILSFDKVLHFIEYAVFAWAWGMVLRELFDEGLRRWAWLFIIAGGLLFGAFDENYQGWIGRARDLFDWYADAAGVVTAQIVQEWRDRRRTRERAFVKNI